MNKLIFINHPKTGKPDVILSLIAFLTIVCGFRFLMDGMNIDFFGHTLVFGHVEPMSYASILAPLLGTHGFIENKQVDPKDEK